MKRSIEAGDLRYVRRRFGNRLDRRKVVRLMQWCKRHKCGERGYELRVNPNRRGVFRSAVHDPVSDGYHRRPPDQLSARLEDLSGRHAMIEPLCRPALLCNRLALSVRYRKPGRYADLLYLATKQE